MFSLPALQAAFLSHAYKLLALFDLVVGNKAAFPPLPVIDQIATVGGS